MIGSTYKCKCGVEKKDANHWYATVKGNGSIQFLTWEAAKGAGVLELPETVHVCGELHAHLELSEFFAVELAKKQWSVVSEQGTGDSETVENSELTPDSEHPGFVTDDYALTTDHCVDDGQQEFPFLADEGEI